MQQVDEVLDFLNRRLGGDLLSWKGDHSSITFEGKYTVDFMKLNSHSLELVSLIPSFQGMLGSDIYPKLLAANYQGTMTGPGRISLTPDEKTLALSCRLDIRSLDEERLEDVIGEFVTYVKFWNSDEARDFFQKEVTEDNTPPSDDPNLFVTRV